jgi:preprotein translocase subunit SecE
MIQQLRLFFSEAKSEFKKISWPTRDEIIGSTKVVCFAIACLMVLLSGYDAVIGFIMNHIVK